MVSLATALSILFFFGLINIVEFFKFIPDFSAGLRKTIITMLLTILTIVAALSAHDNVKNFAELHSNELKYVKSVINDYGVSNLSKTLKIYVRRPRPMPISFSELKGQLTTRGCERAPDVVRLALYEMGIKQDMQIAEGEADDPIPEDKDILVIDMTKFQLNLNKFIQGSD